MKNKIKIKLFDPHTDDSEKKIILKILDNHFWASGAGVGYVEKFEMQFRKFVNSKSCIAVNSGTSALNLALSLIDIKNKDVIVPSFTFVSTVHSILLNGGKPKFIDVNPSTMCLDHSQIEKLINKNTAAIIPVHYGGMSCEMNEIMKISKNYKLPIIEDAAHAAGTKFKKNRIGSHGNIVCFSFHPVKNLAMPTGGLLSINDPNYKIMTDKLRARRWCGISDRKEFEYDVKEMGWNYYMNEFSAGIGLVQLKKLDKMNKARKRIAKIYSKEIKLEEKMQFNNDCSYHLYWIRVKNRKGFMKKMLDDGIETGIHYKPVHKMTFYKSNMKLPKTDKCANEIVSIPIHQNLTDEDISKIIKSINKNSTC